MKQVFVVTIDIPEDISAEVIKAELEEALDDSPLWDAKIEVAKMHRDN